MAKKKVYLLSDDSIANIVKLLQLGILSGTDIVDQLRTLQLVPNGEKLDPAPEYLEALERDIQRMESEAEAISKNQPVGFKGIN